jgi:hypothetical protein
VNQLSFTRYLYDMVGAMEIQAGELVRAAALGDEAAFTELVARHHHDLLSVAYVICRDRALAENEETAAGASRTSVHVAMPEVGGPEVGAGDQAQRARPGGGAEEACLDRSSPIGVIDDEDALMPPRGDEPIRTGDEVVPVTGARPLRILGGLTRRRAQDPSSSGSAGSVRS